MNPSKTPSPASEELRAAVRTLLALAAEAEWEEGTLEVPDGFPWLGQARAERIDAGSYPLLVTQADAFDVPGLERGLGVRVAQRKKRAVSALVHVVSLLSAEAHARDADRLHDDAAWLEGEHGEMLHTAIKRARHGATVLDDSVPAVLTDEARTLTALVPAASSQAVAAGFLEGKARAELISLFAAVAGRLPRAPIGRDVLLKRLADSLDQAATRFDKSTYGDLVRAMLRAVVPVDLALGGSSARTLADDVREDSDRPTSRSPIARRNQRLRAALYALSALACPGDLSGALQQAEPVDGPLGPDL